MCLLTYLQPEAMPDLAALERGAIFNNDGHGWAIIISGDEILTGHSMDSDQALLEFEAARKANPRYAALFHSRIGTQGVETLANCHPFQVRKSPLTVLAHNGILSNPEVRGSKDDPRSDTAILADDVMMRKFAHLDSRRTRRRFERWLGYNNKIVILTVDPRYTCSGYIFNEEAGEWINGCWYSNDSHKPYSARSYGWSYTTNYAPKYTSKAWEDDGWYKGKDGVWRKSESTDLGYPPKAITSGDGWDEDDLDEYEAYLAKRYTCPVCFNTKCIDVATETCTICGMCVGCEEVLCQCKRTKPVTRADVAKYLDDLEATKLRAEIAEAEAAWEYGLTKSQTDYRQRSFDDVLAEIDRGEVACHTCGASTPGTCDWHIHAAVEQHDAELDEGRSGIWRSDTTSAMVEH